MTKIKSSTIKIVSLISLFFSVLLLSACAPEVGSIEWCENLEEKPKGDWTANELSDYAKHCLIPKSED
ncbi:DUF3012 domain-containing protein [Glaciecola petra]|uniref:DUF3012 domain-containing protein n=1 Tax=Glaciecola petra TaxID=3075602 RepID=A0ABU2ZR22_9ALTE|nr:DUF3012 domain-containing protein [Aestuariibacter sp. P117]MDT0595062.1 DUF3012 domain-containing protein [Aestuariibacter sp. P117]